jgi:hypothetical protein
MKNHPATAILPLPNLQALAQLSSQKLRELWPHWFDAPSPANVQRELLARALAYRMQERTHGGLCPDTRTKLRALAEGLKGNPAYEVVETPRVPPGTLLMRQWRDELHQVTVEEAGFVYRGVRYSNLSEIARRITGTRWSGPRFFGVKNAVPTRGGSHHGA